MYVADVSIRAILHDENKYPEPFKFGSERFELESQETNRLAGINDPTQLAFGFGRRCVCSAGPEVRTFELDTVCQNKYVLAGGFRMIASG